MHNTDDARAAFERRLNELGQRGMSVAAALTTEAECVVILQGLASEGDH